MDGRSVVIDVEAHLEAVGTAGTTVIDDKLEAHSGECGTVDNHSGSGNIADCRDAFDTFGDGVIVDVVVTIALNDTYQPHDTHIGPNLLVEGVVEVFHGLQWFA